MKGVVAGYCGEKTLTNFGESFKFDTTLDVQVYMNDTHDTSKYLLFNGVVSGPGSASVNSSAFCNMKVCRTIETACIPSKSRQDAMECVWRTMSMF